MVEGAERERGGERTAWVQVRSALGSIYRVPRLGIAGRVAPPHVDTGRMQPALCERLVECALVDHVAARHLRAKRRTIGLAYPLSRSCGVWLVPSAFGLAHKPPRPTLSTASAAKA